MSNYFKSANVIGTKKVIIKAKQIESFTPNQVNESLPSVEIQENNLVEQLEAKKKQLEQEINALATRKNETLQEIESLLASAQADIATWWAQKELELEELCKEERENAAEQGYHDGYQQGINEIQAQVDEARHVLQTAYTEKKNIIQEAEPFLLSLSVKIAEKIVKKHLAEEQTSWLEIIRSELKTIRDRGEITIEVPTSEYHHLLAYKEELTNCIPAEVELKIVPYDSSNLTGCLIHTPSGSYDVTIDHQLAEIKKQLLLYYREKQHDAD